MTLQGQSLYLNARLPLAILIIETQMLGWSTKWHKSADRWHYLQQYPLVWILWLRGYHILTLLQSHCRAQTLSLCRYWGVAGSKAWENLTCYSPRYWQHGRTSYSNIEISFLKLMWGVPTYCTCGYSLNTLPKNCWNCDMTMAASCSGSVSGCRGCLQSGVKTCTQRYRRGEVSFLQWEWWPCWEELHTWWVYKWPYWWNGWRFGDHIYGSLVFLAHTSK